MIKVLFICHGNICRSTMAQSIFQHLVNQAGLQDHFLIDSAGTSREELGNPVHYGTQTKLRQQSIPCIPHRARQVTLYDAQQFDHLIVMDTHNLYNLKRMLSDEFHPKIKRLLDFIDSSGDIADPWYTGNFDLTYNDILEGTQALLDILKSDI